MQWIHVNTIIFETVLWWVGLYIDENFGILSLKNQQKKIQASTTFNRCLDTEKT